MAAHDGDGGHLPAPARKDDGRKLSSRAASYRRIFRLARPEVASLAAGTVFLALSSGANLVVPRFIGRVVDRAIAPGAPVAALDHVALLLLIAFVVNGVASAFRYALFTISGERVVARLRERLFAKVMEQDIAFFDERKTGELTSRLASDTTVLQNAVSVNISMGLRFVATIVGGIGFLFYTSTQLTALMLAVVPPIALGAVAYGRRVRKLSRDVQDALAGASEVAEEALAGIRTVRVFTAEPHEVSRYGAAVQRSFQIARARSILASTFMSVAMCAAGVATAAVLWRGGRLVLDGKMTAGDLVSFMMYTLFVGFALGGLTDIWADFMKASGAAERIFELMDRAPAIPASGGAELGEVRGRVTFEGVVFSYPTRPDAKVLEGIDLDVRAGEAVALVGPSGAGKSTIAALLSRLYDPVEGRVLLDGKDLRDISPVGLRRRIGVVSQEPILFSGSIAENIRYGRAGATDDEVEEAARMANAHEFVSSVPRRLRDAGGRARRAALRRAEAARRHRAGGAQGPADPDPRRGDERAGRGERAPREGGARPADEGPHDADHRAPPLDGGGRRSRLRPRRWARRPERAARWRSSARRGSTGGSSSGSSWPRDAGLACAFARAPLARARPRVLAGRIRTPGGDLSAATVVTSGSLLAAERAALPPSSKEPRRCPSPASLSMVSSRCSPSPPRPVAARTVSDTGGTTGGMGGSSTSSTTGTGASTTTTTTTSAGTSSGDGAGGKPSTDFPAPFPGPPQVVDFGGPVLSSPKIVPVFFSGDDPTFVAQVVDFDTKVGQGAYWTAAVSEYGVGPATAAPTVSLTEAAATNTTDMDIQTWLADKLDSMDPAWPVPDANTVYVLHYPTGTTISYPDGMGGNAVSCQYFGGYHDNITLQNGMNVAYAVVPRCGAIPAGMGFAGETEIQVLTADREPRADRGLDRSLPELQRGLRRRRQRPPLLGRRARRRRDRRHVRAVSTVCSSSPPGSTTSCSGCGRTRRRSPGTIPACPRSPARSTSTPRPSSPPRPPSSTGRACRPWPCEIPVGETKTVMLDLFSSASTSGPFSVHVDDGSYLNGGPSLLSFGVAPGTPTIPCPMGAPTGSVCVGGENGQKVPVTIKVMTAGPGSQELFWIVSYQNGNANENYWIGMVTN